MRKRALTVEMRSHPTADGLDRLALAVRLVLERATAKATAAMVDPPTEEEGVADERRALR